MSTLRMLSSTSSARCAPPALWGTSALSGGWRSSGQWRRCRRPGGSSSRPRGRRPLPMWMLCQPLWSHCPAQQAQQACPATQRPRKPQPTPAPSPLSAALTPPAAPQAARRQPGEAPACPTAHLPARLPACLPACWCHTTLGDLQGARSALHGTYVAAAAGRTDAHAAAWPASLCRQWGPLACRQQRRHSSAPPQHPTRSALWRRVPLPPAACCQHPRWRQAAHQPALPVTPHTT